ncbi:MAG: hypothetical protein U9Q27_00570, partial [Patescibacteria group bacterium]|nr:hypothetical protein [Patescibacteria group bacterium]
IEILIVISVFALTLGIIYGSYSLSQKAYKEVETTTEINQNARVILERITREIRQAKEIVTELSDEEPIESVSPELGIMFEDGHIEEQYHYIRYFKDNNNIKKQVIVYYFSGSPDTFVPYNAIPPETETLENIILEEKIIGEYIVGIKFWGEEVINISIILEKKDKNINFRTKIFARNI